MQFKDDRRCQTLSRKYSTTSFQSRYDEKNIRGIQRKEGGLAQNATQDIVIWKKKPLETYPQVVDHLLRT